MGGSCGTYGAEEKYKYTLLQKNTFFSNFDICTLLECYAALNGSAVPTFRDNLSVPYLRAKKTLEDGIK